MSRYYYSHNLDSINASLIDNEIIPVLTGPYYHHEIVVLFPQTMGVEWFNSLLLKRFTAISPYFIKTLSDFKEEIYSSIRWEDSSSGDHVLLTKKAKTIVMKQVLNEIYDETDQQAKGEKLHYFASIWNYRGFRRELLDIMTNLKMEWLPGSRDNYVFDLADLQSYIKKSANQESREKLLEIMTIINDYEELKKAFSLIDRQDIDYFLCANLANRDVTNSLLERTKKIFLLNFNSLSNVEAELLKTLSDKGIEIVISFYYDERRGDFFYQGEKLKKLLTSFRFQKGNLNLKPKSSPDQNRNLYLRELAADLFADISRKESYLNEGMLPFDSKPVHVISGENHYEEILNVGKRIKWLLHQDAGLKTDEIAVVARDLTNYHYYVKTVFKKLKLPFYCPFNESIANERLISVILNILELKLKNFPPDLFMSFIKSNYIFLGGEHIGKPHLNTRVIVQDIDSYYQRIKNSQKDILAYLNSLKSFEKEDLEGINRCIVYIEKVRELINRFPSQATVFQLVSLLKDHVNSFSILYNTYKHDELEQAQRDSLVLSKFYNTLDELVYFMNHLQIEKLSLYDFYVTLKDMINESTFEIRKERAHRVHFLEPKEIMGIPYKYVFVVGLVEDEFPKKTRITSLINESEKELFNQKAFIFPGVEELAFQEELYFLHCLTSSVKGIYFSYPKINENGKETLPSFFLDEVATILSETMENLELTIDEEFYCAEEVYDYYGEALFQENQADHPALMQIIDEAKLDKEIIERIAAKGEIEAKRLSVFFSEYEGVLGFDNDKDNELLVNKLQKQIRVISSSHLEMYGHCPHRFMFYHIFRLRKRKTIEETLSASEKGDVVHRVLYHLYQKRMREPDLFKPDNMAWIRDELRRLALESFEEQAKGDKRALLFWGSEFERLVEGITLFVNKDLEENQDYAPNRLEMEFGLDKKVAQLELLDQHGKKIVSVEGIIDRIDQATDEGGFRVIDYKAGKSTISKPQLEREIKQGMRFQPYLYCLKADELFELAIESWNYYFVLNHSTKKIKKVALNLNEKAREDNNLTFMDISKYYIQLYLELIHSGQFQANPRECPDYCEFKNVCRADLLLSARKEEENLLWRQLEDKVTNSVDFEK